MSSTPIEFRLDRDDIGLHEMAEVIEDFYGYLAALDASVSPNGKRGPGFRLTKISYNSPLLLEAAAEPKPRAGDNGPAVAELACRGARVFAQAGARAAGFPYEALAHLRRLAEKSPTEPNHASISAPSLGLRVNLVRGVAGNVERALGQGDSIGAIEGQLDTVSVHDRHYFTLYEARTGQGVKCYFPEKMRSEVIPLLGRRVIAHGQIRRDPSGAAREMRSIDALQPLGGRGRLQSVAGLYEGLNVSDHLSVVRGE